MGKERKKATSKMVSQNGEILLVHTEERHPFSTDILMESGFPIILLNMVFGLLPTTLYGTYLKYLRCSVAQFYTFTFGLCIIILSFLFVPVIIMDDLAKTSGTGMAVMVLIRVTHVGGFILLLIRGHKVAKNIPQIWNQLTKLVQMSIIDVHGRKYHLISRIVSYGRWSTLYYVLFMSVTELTTFFVQVENILPHFYLYYHLVEIIKFSPKWMQYAVTFSYIIWQFCSLSHVLVSMLVGYLIVAIKTCLMATNEELMNLFEGPSRSHPLLTRKRTLVRVTTSDLHLADDSITVKKLNRVKEIMVVAEDLTSAISTLWGISLIIEVLILIANMLVNMYYILMAIQPQKRNPLYNGTDVEDNLDLEYSPMDQTFMLLTEAFIHFYFFYSLCCSCTDMVNEAKQPLQILKTVQYEKHSKRVQESIKSLKADLSSTTITLSATNYFQINKFLLTSVSGALTTYIVVLLQFKAQETPKTSN